MFSFGDTLALVFVTSRRFSYQKSPDLVSYNTHAFRDDADE